MDKMMIEKVIVAELERQGVAYGQIDIAQLADAVPAYNPDDRLREASPAMIAHGG